MSRCSLASLLLGLSLLSTPCLANLRAPVITIQPPSSALFKPQAKISVLGETLDFTCTLRSCRVEAIYRVKATAAVAVSLAFIAPGKNKLSVRVGAHSKTELSLTSSPLSAAERKRIAAGLRRSRADLPLHKAHFVARLKLGKNVIRVRYNQTLSSEEVGHGYFSDGDWLQSLQYELWPLKGWTRDPRFSMTITVRLKRKAPGFFKRTFGNPKSLACRDENHRLISPAEPTQRTGHLTVIHRLKRTFPDRLICTFGPANRLPR